MQARLSKSRTNRVIDGVCGGLAEYLGIDPLLVRLGFIILALLNGIGVLVYILLMIVLPRSDRTAPLSPDEARQANAEFRTRAGSTLRRGDGGALAGTALIIVGVAFLLDRFHLFGWLRFDLLWPMILIVLGVLILTGQLGGSRRAREAERNTSVTTYEQLPPAPEARPAGEPVTNAGNGSATRV